MSTTLRLLLSLLCIICVDVHATSYPISPRPLRKLVIESDAIIVGNVIKVYKKETPKKRKKNISYTNYSYARIVISEVLQGNVYNDTIEIPFTPNMVCPAPARYYEKTTVLVFLDVTQKGYTTHALSYGAKTLDSVGIKIYKSRILEMQDILKISNSTSQKNETVEWLVKCSENPVTCWEGVFELSPGSDFMSSYSHDTDPTFGSYLNAAQKAKLKEAFLSSLDFNYHDFGLSDLVYKENQKEIDTVLLEKLKTLSPNKYWCAWDFMARLKHLNNSPEMENLLKIQKELEFKHNNEIERKKVIDEFVSLVEKNH
ncbi:hypothetical protein GR160_08810 [Flavobacterium sp. Sd200]|uniref:hypothetical protein n=1 Tax=Flavobacterium sp. Sd200 TaxID=2692211 RepID=UPI00136BCFBF|nr:hypothetical protein [Flavobacterium sp. Sd200]MXN91328.1 hypothetical protein [Flavobacterium sp. Sd200]